MKNAALCFLSFVVWMNCCGCGKNPPAPATDSSSETSTPAQAPGIPVVKQSPARAPGVPAVKQSPAQASGVPVIKTTAAPWSRAKEFEWEQGQAKVTMMHRDEGFAYLTGVQGVMPDGSEVTILPYEDGNWYLSGSKHQKIFARAVACPWFVDAEWPVEMKLWKTNQPDFPQLIHQRDGFCVLLKVGGRLVGHNDQFRLHVDENGYWRLAAQSKSPTTRVRVAIIKAKQPGSFRGETREHVWHHGEEPVRLIHSRDGIAFLSGLTGTFWGPSDWARVTLHDDGYWYLEGRTANKKDINARAMTIRLSGTQKTTQPSLAANETSSDTTQSTSGSSGRAKEFEWKHGQPAVKMNHRDDGIALLTGVQGKLIPTSEVGIIQNPDGDWLLEGTPSPSDLSATAVAVPSFAEIERPHRFESWRIEQGTPKLTQIIRPEDGFCAFQMIGGSFRGEGEQYRLLIKDGFWRFNARSRGGRTRTRLLVVKMKQPGSSPPVREYRWSAGNDQPVRMIHGNDGFAFLAGIGGTFESDADFVRVARHDDGYWYLEGGSSKGDVVAFAFAVQLSPTETTPADPSSEPKPSTPTADKLQPPSKADQAIAALKKLGFDVSDDGTEVDIGYSGGEKIKDEDLVHLRSLPGVTELGLYDVPLTDTGVQHLSGLKNLQSLELNNSQITNEGLKVIGQLKNLEVFELGDSENVTGAGLMHLRELTKLRELRLFYLELRPGDLAFANDLINLETLHLKSNENAPDESDLEVLGKLTKLTTLSLYRAGLLNNNTISHLSNLNSLTYLNLDDTSISDRAMQTVKEFTRLEILHLRGTRVGDLGIRHLAGMEHLKELHLSGSQVGGRGISSLADCPNLTELFLDSPDTTDRHLSGVKDLKQLKKLYLNGEYDYGQKRSIPTHITVNGLKYLAELEQLEALHMMDNPQITDEAVPILSQLKSLYRLKLEGTGITPAGGRKIADEIEGLDFDDLGL